jgi:hypothetical protein
MFIVSYTIKKENGLLIEKNQVFNTLSECQFFLLQLRANGNLVGKPILS